MAAQDEKPSFGRLARRISAWTTNCLLSAIILLAGYGFGVQVLRWWKPGQRTAPPAVADDLGNPWQRHELRFSGQPWALGQQMVSGDQAAATAALLADCRKLLEAAPAEPLPPNRQPGSDAAFLASLAQLKPAAEQPGKWRLYELPNGFPMVVGTRQSAATRGTGTVFGGGKLRTGDVGDAENGASPRLGTAHNMERKGDRSMFSARAVTEGNADWPKNGPVPAASGSRLAETTSRMVIWGLAIPVRDRVWTLYTFQPRPDGQGGADATDAIPIPPGSQRIVAMRAARGSGITSFAGSGPAASWREFYDGWFRGHGWQTAAGWEQAGASWHARYARPGASAAGQPKAVDIRLSREGTGGCTGLWMTN